MESPPNHRPIARSGAVIILPLYPDDDKVLEHHLRTARTTLDGFGIADSKTFDADLQKAG
jgi:hypothetical protein